MKRHTKWLFAALFVLAGVLFLPKAQTEAQAAARINYTSLKLKQGTTKKLKIKDSSAKVQWSSSKPNVVAVNKKGRITAVKGGKAVITAKTRKKEFRCKVTVTGLNTSTLTLSKGTKYTPEDHQERGYTSTVLCCGISPGAGDPYFAVFEHASFGKTLLIFNPDEKIVEGLKKNIKPWILSKSKQ